MRTTDVHTMAIAIELWSWREILTSVSLSFTIFFISYNYNFYLFSVLCIKISALVLWLIIVSVSVCVSMVFGWMLRFVYHPNKYILYYMIIIVICVRIFVSDSDTRPEREIVSIAQTALLVHSSVRFRRRSLDPTCSQRYVLVCSSVVLRLYVFFFCFLLESLSELSIASADACELILLLNVCCCPLPTSNPT